jgi:hypothetical protein
MLFGIDMHRRSAMANPGGKLTFPPLLSDAEIEAGRKPRPGSGPPAYDPWPPLEARFPRIAKTVRERWGTCELDGYLDRLLIDDRGNRDGFPPEVVEALLALSHRHIEQFRFRVPGERDWTNPPPLVGRR